MKYTATTQGLIAARRPAVKLGPIGAKPLTELLPKTIASGAVLTTVEEARALAVALGEETKTWITEREILSGAYDSDPLLREWTVPDLSPRRAERARLDARALRFQTAPLHTLTDIEVMEARDYTAYDEDQTRHLELEAEMNRRMESQAIRDAESRLDNCRRAAAFVTANPDLLRVLAMDGKWNEAVSLMPAYVETPAAINLRKTLERTWLERIFQSSVSHAQKAVSDFLAGNPEIWSEK